MNGPTDRTTAIAATRSLRRPRVRSPTRRPTASRAPSPSVRHSRSGRGARRHTLARAGPQPRHRRVPRSPRRRLPTRLLATAGRRQATPRPNRPTTTPGRDGPTTGRSRSGRIAIPRATGRRRLLGRPAQPAPEARAPQPVRPRPLQAQSTGRPTSWRRARSRGAASQAVPPIGSRAARTSPPVLASTCRRRAGLRPVIRPRMRIPSWPAWSAGLDAVACATARTACHPWPDRAARPR
jgi:hypothetical protein